jgi:hypothetical protein
MQHLTKSQNQQFVTAAFIFMRSTDKWLAINIKFVAAILLLSHISSVNNSRLLLTKPLHQTKLAD